MLRQSWQDDIQSFMSYEKTLKELTHLSGDVSWVLPSLSSHIYLRAEVKYGCKLQKESVNQAQHALL